MNLSFSILSLINQHKITMMKNKRQPVSVPYPMFLNVSVEKIGFFSLISITISSSSGLLLISEISSMSFHKKNIYVSYKIYIHIFFDI